MTQRGPQPWPDCDTSSEEWRRYTEAWSHIYQRGDVRSITRIGNFRGWEAGLVLEHDIKIVQRDYDGAFPNRSDIAKHMRWKPTAKAVEERARLEKSKSAGRRS